MRRRRQCGCAAVLCVIGFLEKSGYTIRFAANADGSGSYHGKANCILRTRQVSQEDPLDSSGATRQGDRVSVQGKEICLDVVGSRQCHTSLPNQVCCLSRLLRGSCCHKESAARQPWPQTQTVVVPGGNTIPVCEAPDLLLKLKLNFQGKNNLEQNARVTVTFGYFRPLTLPLELIR